MSHSAKSEVGSRSVESLAESVIGSGSVTSPPSTTLVTGTSCRTSSGAGAVSDDLLSTTVTSTVSVVATLSELTVKMDVTEVVIVEASVNALLPTSTPGDCNGVAFGVELAELWNQLDGSVTQVGYLLSPSFMP